MWRSALRVNPVELVGCFPTGHMTVLWLAAPRQRVYCRAPGRRSCPLRLALSAPLPGDFRPVIVSVFEKNPKPGCVSSPKKEGGTHDAGILGSV